MVEGSQVLGIARRGWPRGIRMDASEVLVELVGEVNASLPLLTRHD